MSVITGDPDRSPRDCATKRHHHHTGCRINGRLLVTASSGAASLLALAIILRPPAPRFRLLAATATASNANATVALLDAALLTHNPNARAAALYDSLWARASYAGIQLTADAPLPPFEQAQGDAMLSASLSSSSSAPEVPTAETGPSPALLILRIEGRLLWMVAARVSGGRTIAAECVAVVAPSRQLRAVVVQGSQCATTIDRIIILHT